MDDALIERRAELRKEYDAAVERGEVRPLTSMERVERKAAGHPDNASTQAAQRILEKRKTAADQIDAFGVQRGDERRALERAGEGRKRSEAAQKAPGSDGGLFDQRDTTGELAPIAQARASLQQAIAALDAAEAKPESLAIPDTPALRTLLRDWEHEREAGREPEAVWTVRRLDDGGIVGWSVKKRGAEDQLGRRWEPEGHEIARITPKDLGGWKPPAQPSNVVPLAPPKRTQSLYQRLMDSDEPIFYSELERAVEASTTTRASAAQWAATLGRAQGVKREELEWSGIFDWLDMQEGPVSRDDLLRVVRDGGIRVEEVVLGGGFQGRDIYAYENEDGDWEVRHPSVTDDNMVAGPFDTEGQARAYIRENQPVQFKEWSSDPNNDTYRELLITLPIAEGGNPVRAPATHFDQEAVVAHARFMEKRDAEGKRVLFVEEIQSDWHQKGRGEGYEVGTSPERIAAAEKEADDARAELEAARRALHDEAERIKAQLRETATDKEFVEEIIKDHVGRSGSAYDQDSSDLRIVRDLGQIGKKIVGDQAIVARFFAASLRVNEAGQVLSRSKTPSGVPDAPFKSSWPALVIKRLIRLASDQGFEKIAWTTGDEQNERYSLSRVINLVRSERRGEHVLVRVGPDSAAAENALITATGAEGYQGGGGGVIMTRDQAISGFGNSLGARIFDEATEEGKLFEGLDLDLAGSGMRAFYDRNLVNITNDIIKKYGGKVGTVDVIRAKATRISSDMKADAMPGFDITPAMAAAAQSGFSLFQRGPVVDRRTFIKGATAVAGGFMVGDRLFAQPPGLTSILERSMREAGPLTEPLEWIAQNSENAQFRRFARRMIPLVNGVVIRGAEQGTATHPDGTAVPEDIAEGLAHGMHQVDEATDGDVIWLAKGDLVNGFNEGTVVHEALHAAIYRIFGRLSVRMGGSDPALLRREGFRREATPRPASEAQIAELRGLYQEAVTAFERNVEGMSAEESRSDATRHLRNALSSPDEFLSWALENPNVQAFLREQPSTNSSLKRASLWDRIVAFIRRVLGFGDTPRSALDDVLDTGYRLISDPQGPTSETNQVVENPSAAEFNRGSATGRQRLSRLSADPTKLPAFKRWFGKSKVVDENGAPLVVYHGSKHSFDVFESKSADVGFHFGTEAQAGNRPNITEVRGFYLKADNLLRLADINLWKGDNFVGALEDAGVVGPEAATEAYAGRITVDRAWALEHLRAAGFDGIVYRNQSEGPGDSYMVFSPTQIKSVDNRGTFDPKDSRSLYQRASEYAFEPEVEKRWQDARKGVGSGASMISKGKAAWDSVVAGMTRHWRYLPNSARFADLREQFRKLEASPEVAKEETVRHLRKVVGKMTAEEYDLFTRKVVLDDLQYEVEREHQLPFGLTPETVEAERQRIDAAFSLNPKLVEALDIRREHNRKIADEMVAEGILTPEQVENPSYFRHMVLDYARAERQMARGTGEKISSPWWAKRAGSSLDINANFLEAEADWMLKAMVDIQTAKAIRFIQESEHNIREDLRAQARARNKEGIDAAVAKSKDLASEEAEFRKRIAIGLTDIRKALESGDLTAPPTFQAAADSLTQKAPRDEAIFPLLSWVLENNKPGARGAAMTLKAISQRRAWARQVLGSKYLNPENMAELAKRLAPEGYVGWQPREGRHLFTAKTLPEHVVDRLISNLADVSAFGIGKDEMHRALETIKPQLVVGGDRYTMVIPKEVADTLDEFGDVHAESMVARLFSGVQAAWKRWVLINPRRFFKYNLNNQLGDLDAVIAGHPATLRKVGPAARELYRVMAKGEEPSQTYRDAQERGVFTSGLSLQEIPDINRLSALKHLTDDARSTRPDKLLVGAVAKVWRGLQGTTNFREAIFRYAAYLSLHEKMEAGQTQAQIGYGASVPKLIDAVTDNKDRAALMARDLVGDYGAVSVVGQWLRKYMIPFWSWTEINTRRYFRLTANIYRGSKAKGIAAGSLLGAGIAGRTAVSLGIRMALVYGIITLYNHLLFGDEEDDLSEQQKRQLHIILGRDSDGKVVSLRAQGALSDVLGTLGFPDAMAAFRRAIVGQGDYSDILTAAASAPVNRVGTSVTPIFGEPLEQALGLELWPDMFHPRPIQDRLRHIFSTVSAENEYDVVADRPSRGYWHSWTESIVYRRDPGEMAYDDIRSVAHEWLEHTRGESGTVNRTDPKSRALRDYRQALRYGDQDAARDALERFRQYEGTRRGLRQSIARAHPLGSIPKRYRRAFIRSLTDDQRETLRDAEEFYSEVYLHRPRHESE